MAGEDARLVSFVTEKEVEEIKRKRQEQWEKVRKPGEPKERPQEEVYDPRPLYERLKEQREKEEEIKQEKFKLKNMVYKGLDEEELKFLNTVAHQQANREMELLKQERDEINTFREAVAQLNAKESEQLVISSVPHTPVSPTIKTSRKSQIALISSTIIRKRNSNSGSTSIEKEAILEKKAKNYDNDDDASETTKSKDKSRRLSGLASLASYSSSDDEN